MGQHPLVSPILKAAFNLRLPMPRYKDTWKVSKVLRYHQSLGLNESLFQKLNKEVSNVARGAATRAATTAAALHDFDPGDHELSRLGQR